MSWPKWAGVLRRRGRGQAHEHEPPSRSEHRHDAPPCLEVREMLAGGAHGRGGERFRRGSVHLDQVNDPVEVPELVDLVDGVGNGEELTRAWRATLNCSPPRRRPRNDVGAADGCAVPDRNAVRVPRACDGCTPQRSARQWSRPRTARRARPPPHRCARPPGEAGQGERHVVGSPTSPAPSGSVFDPCRSRRLACCRNVRQAFQPCRPGRSPAAGCSR